MHVSAADLGREKEETLARVHQQNGNDLKYFSRNNKDFTGSYNTDDPARSHGLNVAPALRR